MLRTTVTFSAVALAAVLCAPAGLSVGWVTYGGHEPDTHYDSNDGYMWTSGPGSDSHRVYFNAFQAQGPVLITSLNSGTLGSRIVGSPLYNTWDALLGVWADCNHDGFVGLADGAMLEYDASVSNAAGSTVDTTLCPDVADSAANAGTIHNHGGWITELIPIAPDPTGANARQAANISQYRILFDPTVKIWGDLVQPKTPASAPQPTTGCAETSIIPPFGKGQTGHTGGIVDKALCDESTLFGATPDQLAAFVANNDPTGTVSGLGLPAPSTVYAPLQSGGSLDVQTLGTEQSCKGDPQNPPSQPCPDGSNSFVYGEQDCSQSAPVLVSDPAKGTPLEGGPADPGDVIGLRPVGSPQTNPQGSIVATYNETTSEFGNCDANQHGTPFYGNGVDEAGNAGNIKVVGKSAAQANFGFQGPAVRGSCDAQTAWQFEQAYGLSGLGDDPIPGDPAAVPPALCGAPANAGLLPGELATSVFFGASTWWATSQYLGMTPNVNGPGIDRTTIPPSVTPNTFGSDWTTFYATVDLSGYTTPGNVGTYGNEWCTSGIGPGAGIQFGWDCDPADWNLDPNTGGKLNNADLLGNVGDSYNLRDVDCYDTTVVSGSSSANPTGQDIGGRTVGTINDPNNGCS